MSRTTDPVLELKGSLARSKALRSRPHAAHVFSAWRARRRGGQFREGMKQARRPSHGNGGTRCPDAIFSASSREPAGRGCVSLPRHETAWFGCERRAWRELEGIGAPGADDRSVSSPECVQYMRVPVAAPLRVGASPTCPLALSGDRHRYDLAGRSAPHPATSTLRIASESGMAPRTRAAIKPSLTLTRLILPRCKQAP